MSFVPPAEALEIIQWALLKEKHYPAQRNPAYLSEVQRHGMTPTWRLRMCRWMFGAAKDFELQLDTVYSALHFLDEYLSMYSVTRVTLQLLGMVCMWTASKMHEDKPILLAEMALMCERKFSRTQMVDAEAQLVELIGFRFNPPNAFTMARDFVNELPFDGDEGRRANCVASVLNVLEHVLEDFRSVNCSASSLAKVVVELVAKFEYNLTAPQVLEALEFVQIDEKDYRVAFIVVCDAYFGAPTQAAPIKLLTQSPRVVDSSTTTQSPGVVDSSTTIQSPRAVDSSTVFAEIAIAVHTEGAGAWTGDEDNFCVLFCTDSLSPSPAQALPAPVRTARAISCIIGITRPLEAEPERPSKRQRKLSM